MALSRRSGRSRFTLILLVLSSVTILTLDFRGSSAVQGLRDGAAIRLSVDTEHLYLFDERGDAIR